MKLIFEKKHRTKLIIGSILAVIIAFFLYYFSFYIYNLLRDVGAIKEFILSFGVFAPLALISIQIIKVFLVFFPGQIISIPAGYVFGPWLGALYILTGSTIGSVIAFMLSRRYGRPFVERTIKKESLDNFDSYFKKKGTFALFIIYLLPATPDDAVSFAAGLTNISLKKFIPISFIGRIPGILALTLIGNGVLSGSNLIPSIIMFLCLMTLSLIIYFNREKVEEVYRKLFRKNK